MSSFIRTSAVLRSRSSSLSVLSSSFADCSSSLAVSSSSFVLRSSSSLDCASSAAAEASSASCSRSSMAAASACRRPSISVPLAGRLRLALRRRRGCCGTRSSSGRGPAAGRTESLRNATQRRSVAVHDENVFPGDDGLFPERAADRGPQHRQDLVMTDQAEEVEGSFSRFQRDERSDLAANARDLHLFVDEHTAGSEMRGQEDVVLVVTRRGARDAARRTPRQRSAAASGARRRTWPARPGPGACGRSAVSSRRE